jgi:cytochrome c
MRFPTVLLAVGALLLAGGCAPSGGASAAPPPPTGTLSPDAQAGQRLMAQKGCGACHIIPGVSGANGVVGPSLAGVASRATIAGGAVPNRGPDDLKKWIMDPPALKPDTQMPNLGLSDDEATKIVAYLELLK